MARLIFIVEGQTEQTFAHTVLAPHLAEFNVFAGRPILTSTGRRKGVVRRGGMVSYAAMKADIVRLLAQHRDRDVFFTTMIDLYGLSTDFPGWEAGKQLRHVPEERVELLETEFGQDVGDSRFIPHIQLFEFEAILFSNPTCFRLFYEDHEKQIAQLADISRQCDGPERINDDPNTAPSKRITRVFPDFAKSVEGPQIAESIGLEQIRECCPHFSRWVEMLEGLAT